MSTFYAKCDDAKLSKVVLARESKEWDCLYSDLLPTHEANELACSGFPSTLTAWLELVFFLTFFNIIMH